MHDFTPTGRQFFAPLRPVAQRFHTPKLKDVRSFRDRIALGYYDHPDLTEAAVTRMLQMLNAKHN